MKTLIPSLLLLATASSAYALEYGGRNHFPYTWSIDEMPVRYDVADDGTVESHCQDSMEPGECYMFAEMAAEQWNNVDCAGAEATIIGLNDNVYDDDDGIISIVFEDPEGEMDDPATLAYAPCEDLSSTRVEINGLDYQLIEDCRIVFGEGKLFDSPEDIEAGCPQGGHSFLGTMTHEMGHSLGMAHTCEEGEICTDPEKLGAVMYWTGPECDTSGDTLTDLDKSNFQAMYGPYASFECSHEGTGGDILQKVPFELKCTISSDDLNDVTAVNWVFGDGGESQDISPTHTYTEPGNYTIQVTVEGQSEGCGEDGWSYNYRRVGYVTACDAVQGEFTYEHVDGLQYKMLNDSDVSVYGCISEIEWNVFEGDSASGQPIQSEIRAWEPVIEFPENGTYTVVMNLGGPGGTTAASLTIEAKSARGNNSGCSTVSAGLGAAGGLALLGIAATRRRRER